MKKGKFLKTLTIFGTALCAPILLTGCMGSTENNVDFRVYNGYIQTTTDGTTWENLIAISDLKGLDGVNGTDADVYTIGADGYWYKNGVKTGNKAVGTNGNGIKSIAKDTINSTTEKTIYIITFDDNTTTTFEVINGTDGDNADVWTIGNDGYWYLNGNKTDNKAIGDDGDEYTIGADGYWYLNGNKTDYKAIGADADVWTIGSDGYWYKNGVITEYKAIGVDATYTTYTITYDYDFTGNEEIFDCYKTTQEIKSTEWLIEMPTPKSSFDGEFDGWYIKDTNKKIENYDFIGGNVTLEARWNSLPAGYYNNSTYLNWIDFATTYSSAIEGTAIVSTGEYLHPSYFESLQGILVLDDSITEIKDEAFDHSKLSKIVMQNSITTLGESVFSYCTQLTEITLSDNIKDIKDSCFYECSKLEQINIPNGVETIGSIAFLGCRKLTEVNIPESVNSIYKNPFEYCSSLTKIVVDTNNITYDCRDNCNAIIEKATNTLVVGCNSTIIPSNVTGIGYFAFEGSHIEKVTIPASVKVFGENIFDSCTSLNEVTISEGITELGRSMFTKCSSLKNIVIPSTLTYIPMSAFVNCSNLNSVTMDNNSNWTTAYLEDNFSFTYTTGKESYIANLFTSIDDEPPYPSSYGVWVRKVNDYGYEIKNAEIKINTVGDDTSYIDCTILHYDGAGSITLDVTDFTVVSNGVTYNIDHFYDANYQQSTITTISSSTGLQLYITTEEGKDLLNSDSIATIYYKGQEIAKIN